jgi:lysophospholipase L1-like esterase
MAVRPRLVLLGDSITQQSFSLEREGWGAALADLYQQKLDVINRGASGYNTRWTLQLMPSIFPASEPAPIATVIFFGANDAVQPGLSGTLSKQHVPLEEYEANLVKIVAHIKSVGCRHVYIGAASFSSVFFFFSFSSLFLLLLSYYYRSYPSSGSE